MSTVERSNQTEPDVFIGPRLSEVQPTEPNTQTSSVAETQKPSFLIRSREWAVSNKPATLIIGGLGILTASLLLTRGGDSAQQESTRITTTVEVENPDGSVNREVREEVIPLAPVPNQNEEMPVSIITEEPLNPNSVASVEYIIEDGIVNRLDHYVDGTTNQSATPLTPFAEEIEETPEGAELIIPQPKSEDPVDIINNLELMRNLAICIADAGSPSSYSVEYLNHIYDSPGNSGYQAVSEILPERQPQEECESSWVFEAEVIEQREDRLIVETVYNSNRQDPTGPYFSELYKLRVDLALVNGEWRYANTQLLEDYTR